MFGSIENIIEEGINIAPPHDATRYYKIKRDCESKLMYGESLTATEIKELEEEIKFCDEWLEMYGGY